MPDFLNPGLSNDHRGETDDYSIAHHHRLPGCHIGSESCGSRGNTRYHRSTTHLYLAAGENLSSLCANIRQGGVDISIPDCVKQILFANRQWFDNTFGYVWQDPAA